MNQDDKTKPGLELRGYVFIDNMQPQYAALTGTVVKGDIPLAGMAQLYLEVLPGSEVMHMLDVALKQSDAKPGFQIIEREFGIIELHSFAVESVKSAGEAVLRTWGLSESQRRKPKIVSSKLITNVNPYQAQLINRVRKGSLLVPGESLYVIEIEPACYAALVANEAEKAAHIKLIDFDPVGRYGRVYVSGSESQVKTAGDAAYRALSALSI